MSVLICGDRYWNNEKMMKEILSGQEIDILIHRDCIGADTIAGKIGKRAGPIRNKQMLEDNAVDLVLAFHDDIENSKGTKNMINQAKTKNISIILISSNGKYVEY